MMSKADIVEEIKHSVEVTVLDKCPGASIKLAENTNDLDIKISDKDFELNIQVEKRDQLYDDLLVTVQLVSEGDLSTEEIYSGSLDIDSPSDTLKSLETIIINVFKHELSVFKRKRILGGSSYEYVFNNSAKQKKWRKTTIPFVIITIVFASERFI